MRSVCARVLTGIAALVVISGVSVSPLEGQRLGPAQKRPKLAAGADTNDALAYLTYAARELESAPDAAAAAFYWAARLDPSSADALYGRRIALLMRKASTLAVVMEGKKSRSGKEFRMMDSLHLRALWLDPLLYRRFDRTMIMAYYRNVNRADFGSAPPSELDRAIMAYLDGASASYKAWFAYSSGRMDQALVHYEDALKRAPKSAGLRMDRGRVYAIKGQVTPALADFTAAIALIKAREDKKDEDVIFYDSKALAEHSIGLLWTQKGDLDSATAAFGRATAEDLSYHPAHVALGVTALARHDSVTAVSELALAAELAVDDPWTQFLYGGTLLVTGQHAEAVAPLKKSIELEEFFAAPHFALGRALERSDPAAARASYERFIALSSRRNADRAVATERVAALAKSGAR